LSIGGFVDSRNRFHPRSQLGYAFNHCRQSRGNPLPLELTGGGAEIKDIHIPKVDGIWRLTSLLSGILFVFLKSLVVGQSNSSEKPAAVKTETNKPLIPMPTPVPTQNAPAPALSKETKEAVLSTPKKPAPRTVPRVQTEPKSVPHVQIEVEDALSEYQITETVDLKLGAFQKVHMYLSQASPKSTIYFNVPAVGNLKYTMTSVVTYPPGTIVLGLKSESGSYTFRGSGQITAEAGHHFTTRVLKGKDATLYVALRPTR
jgi:hypothetical protein